MNRSARPLNPLISLSRRVPDSFASLFVVDLNLADIKSNPDTESVLLEKDMDDISQLDRNEDVFTVVKRRLDEKFKDSA